MPDCASCHGIALQQLVGSCHSHVASAHIDDHYRLGDLVIHKKWRDEQVYGAAYHQRTYPTSIASEYLRLAPNDDKTHLGVLADIVKRRRVTGLPASPTTSCLPDAATLVVHLRLGDVVEAARGATPLPRAGYGPTTPAAQYVRSNRYYENVGRALSR